MLTIEQAFPNGVCGVIRTDDPDIAFKAALAAVEGGVGTVEVTTTVPSCFEIVRGLLASTGGTTPVGVGTVWDPGAVQEAKDAGASFVVTPVLLPEVAEAARQQGLICVLGALTPSEIYQARVMGANLVKVYPVSSVGGPDYIKLLNGPLAGVPFWVSGGVEIDQVASYLKLGVKAVGLTNALFDPKAMADGDIDKIRELAGRAAAAAGALKP